jgi:hypothetical protein
LRFKAYRLLAAAKILLCSKTRVSAVARAIAKASY